MECKTYVKNLDQNLISHIKEELSSKENASDSDDGEEIDSANLESFLMQTVENEELKDKNQEMISEIKMTEINANIKSESGDVEKNSQIEYLG